LNPRMSKNFIECKSSVRIQLEHSSDQIFKFFTDFSLFTEHFPEVFRFVSSNQSVVFVIDLSLVEWLALSDHHEKNNSHGKQIRLLTGVSFFSMLFWRHVSKSSFIGIQFTVAFVSNKWDRKTKIGDFWFEIGV
jgi:hypothetical protein